MVHLTEKSAECLVFTYKEGLFAPLAHDLKIRVTKFSIAVDEQTRAIEARFDATSLRVVCAMNDAAEAPGTLTRDNKREIEGNILRDVLDAVAYPEIHFVSSGVEQKQHAYVIKGALTLRGKRRQIKVEAHEEEGGYVAEARIRQPDFGIRPYSALLGALKVKPDVTVRVSVSHANARSASAAG